MSEIEIIQPTLGLKPFILVEVNGFDAEDNPILGIRFGGGLEEDALVDFFGYLAISMGFDFAAALEGVEPDAQPD